MVDMNCIYENNIIKDAFSAAFVHHGFPNVVNMSLHDNKLYITPAISPEAHTQYSFVIEPDEYSDTPNSNLRLQILQEGDRVGHTLNIIPLSFLAGSCGNLARFIENVITTTLPDGFYPVDTCDYGPFGKPPMDSTEDREEKHLEDVCDRKDQLRRILLVAISNGDKIDGCQRKIRTLDALITYFHGVLDSSDSELIHNYTNWKKDSQIIWTVNLPGFILANYIPEWAKEHNIDCFQHIVKPEDETELRTYALVLGPASIIRLRTLLADYFVKAKPFRSTIPVD